MTSNELTAEELLMTEELQKPEVIETDAALRETMASIERLRSP